MRDGEEKDIPVEQIVPGDIIVLRAYPKGHDGSSLRYISTMISSIYPIAYCHF